MPEVGVGTGSTLNNGGAPRKGRFLFYLRFSTRVTRGALSYTSPSLKPYFGGFELYNYLLCLKFLVTKCMTSIYFAFSYRILHLKYAKSLIY